jgi:Ni,Fe-hydrogenase III small subunit/NAD-dependent dihydropyrimidine dehydrogenase PreA subunit
LFKTIRVRASQGTQYIPDPRLAKPLGWRGRPLISADACAPGCQACAQACPVQAITLGPQAAGAPHPEPVAIDLGRCTVCGDCEPACPSRKLSFDNHVPLASTERAGLRLSAARPAPDPVQVCAALHARFGRSLKLRSVSAGGCNGCELEVNALSNVNFDIGRYGIDIVASPRHADGLVLTGPITRNMALALQSCWDAMPEPKLVIAVGACAISGAPFEGSSALERSFLERFKPALYVPGCPPHPLTFICGILDLLGISS